MSSRVDPPLVVLHRRQFVVGPKPVRVSDDWITAEFEPGLWLSHCSELRVAHVRGADDTAWALLGLAVQTLDGEPAPEAQLAAAKRREVAAHYEAWAGRWILIGAGELHPDATALRACFFGRAGDRSWASSSPVLLARALGAPDASRARGAPLRHERGVSWFPPPGSYLDGIDRVLPSQVLDLREGTVRPRRLLPPLGEGPYDAVLAQFESALVNTAANVASLGTPIWVSLSGGADSRLVLATAHRGLASLRVFTRISTRMSVADCELPPRMARDLDHAHTFLRSGGAVRGREALVTQHSGANVSWGDAQPLVEGQRDELEGISIGGCCFEVGRRMRRRTQVHYADLDATIAAISVAYGEPADSVRSTMMRRWLAWVRETEVPGLDWRDRFYLEQRIAGWQSAKEQLYDMNRHERFFPVNCARTYALMLSLPEARRVGAGHHLDIVRRLTPEIADYPVNPPDRSFGVARMLRILTVEARGWRRPVALARRVAAALRRRRH